MGGTGRYTYHLYTIPTHTEPTQSRSTRPRWKTKTGRGQPSPPEQSLCHLQQRQPPSKGLSIAIPLTNSRAPCSGGTYKSGTSVAKCRGVGKLLGNLSSSARLTGCPKKNGSIAPSGSTHPHYPGIPFSSPSLPPPLLSMPNHS